ncbi:MAG: hypothetical protein COV66_05670 [Nitrospinae bacterium CG11_big_fil_rev_8_21_14_0_20_45_15]|nr:MAG: hypothetical protein COV66_05670 [Nitrospinae bacterium CG11_big_fil_rev_8_21_14_0_20_45_15]
MAMTPPDWSVIHKQEFTAGSCWKDSSCYCCVNNHPDFSFQLLPSNGTTLLYMEGEYDFLKKTGQVLEKTADGKPPQFFSFEFGGPKPLNIFHTPCYLAGLCEGVIQKPLLCKLYPFIPVLDTDGALETIVPASIYDITFDILGASSPCSVFDQQAEYFQRWSTLPAEIQSLQHPSIILYLQAIKFFVQSYEKKVKACKELQGLSGKKFWSKWELLYLGRKLVDTERLRIDVKKTYLDLEKKFGEFLC